jgi:hypothetical protein
MVKLNRVTVNTTYVYQPVMMDRCDPKTDLRPGMRVQVVKSPAGCPPANTMGHCYVARNGKLVGLVHCNSLADPDKEGIPCEMTDSTNPK